MEGIILQLLNDDNVIREQGVVKLTEACKTPHGISNLFQIINSATNPKIKNEFNKILPQLVDSIKVLAESDKNQAEVLQLIDGLRQNALDVLSPHVAILVITCINIAKNKLLDLVLRVKALRIIKSLADTKNLTIRNNELVAPIIDLIYSILKEPVDNEFGEFYTTALWNCWMEKTVPSKKDTPVGYALHILYILSKHSPPQELASLVLLQTEPMFEDPDISVRRGCYLSLAIVVEHCSQFVEEEYLKYLRKSFTDSNPVIKNTAQFMLGQFIRFVGTNHSERAAELLPVLTEYLDNSLTEIRRESDLQTIDTLFYTLDAFCEEYVTEMTSYLPRVMEYLFGILESDTSNRVKKLAVKTFTIVARTFDKETRLYYPRFIKFFDSLVAKMETEGTTELRDLIFATVDPIVFYGGRILGKEDISPAVEYFIKLSVEIVKTSKSPTERTAVYNNLSLLSIRSPDNVASILPQIFDNIMESVRIVERTEVNPSEDSVDVEQTNGEYVEEKRVVIEVLATIYSSVGNILVINYREAFLPYLESVFKEAIKAVSDPKSKIRITLLFALSQFYRISSRYQLPESSRQMLLSSSEVLIQILLEIIYETTEVDIVTTAANLYSEVLIFLNSESSILEKIKKPTAKCITDILSGDITCLNIKETLTERGDVLKEAGARMLESYFQSGINSEELVTFFEQLLPLFQRYLAGEITKTPKKELGMQLIHDCFRGLGHRVSKFAPEFVPLFTQSVSDPKLGSAAVNGIVLITRYGGSAIDSYYPDILEALLSALQKETDDVKKDKLTSTLGSLIWTNYSNLPLEEVFPIFVSHLPLKAGIDEYKAVFGGILTLIKDHHVILNDHIRPLVKIAVNVLQDDTSVYYKEATESTTEFLRIARQDYPDVWKETSTFLSPEEVGFVEKLSFAEAKDVAVPL